jgi:hypothetical protein
MGGPRRPKRAPPRRAPGGLANDRRSWRPSAHDGERRLAQQELRDAVVHHALLTVEAILTDGTIDAAARVDLDVRGAEQLDDWGLVTHHLLAW